MNLDSKIEGLDQWKTSTESYNYGQLGSASRMCTHHKYEIFTPSAPQQRVYFRLGQVTKEAGRCKSQHSAKHWKAGREGTGWETEKCDRGRVKMGYLWVGNVWGEMHRGGCVHSDESWLRASRAVPLDRTVLYMVSGLTKVISDGRQPLQRSHGLQWSRHRPHGAYDHQGRQMQSQTSLTRSRPAK